MYLSIYSSIPLTYLTSPNLPEDLSLHTIAHVISWGVASAVAGLAILYFGQHFVDAPKLVHKKKMD